MTLAEIWRYPVKSMHGQSLAQADLFAYGLEGDRLYAFESPEAPAGMLRLRAPDRRRLLAFKALSAPAGVKVVSPGGQAMAVDSPDLLPHLPPGLRLTQEPRPQTDVRPLALISLQTIQQLSQELGIPLDPRRFRANLLLDLDHPFQEDEWTGRNLQIGAAAKIRILERDPRCRFITFDPDQPDAEPLTPLMRLLDLRHQNRAGVYASVVEPGPISRGDTLRLA